MSPDEPQYNPLKEAFFTGAKSVVVLAGAAMSPQFSGDKPQVGKMARVMSAVEQESTAYIRHKYANDGAITESKVIVPGGVD